MVLHRVLAWALLLVTSPLAAQSGAVRVDGAVPAPVTVSREELGSAPRLAVSASDHGRPPVRYEGVPLAEVLRLAGFDPSARRPGALAMAVVVEAADGDRVAFAMAELDAGFRDKVILLADRADGQPLDDATGPLRLVVPDERRAGRWVRQVTRISVVPVQAP